MNRKFLGAATVVSLAALAAGLAPLSVPPANSGPEAVAKVLDAFHDAASRPDEAKYFGLLSEDAVFLGTDATERWTKKEFRAFAKPFFDQGQGWTYFPREGKRFISVSTDGATAWFDEVLDNAKYGECRGTGVLVRTGNEWKIAQYNLTVPVPNDLLNQVVDMIRKQKPKPAK